MIYDIAIIGAGIIGSLIAQKLSKYNIKTCLIDKETEPAQGAVKANSAIIHAGYDALPGTLKAYYNIKGNEIFQNICDELEIELKNIGSMVLSLDKYGDESVKELYKRGIDNKVKHLEIIGKQEILQYEPNVNSDVRLALYSKSASIVSPYELTIAAAENAIENGVDSIFDFNVKKIKQKGNIFEISSNDHDCEDEDKNNIKTVQSKYIINCAGVKADEIANEPEFKIMPRKGEYFVLDKKQDGFINHILFSPPTEKGKGILACPTVHGNIILGPTSEFIENKENKDTTYDGMQSVKQKVKQILPGINFNNIITSFSGIRATPNTHDFYIGWSKVYQNFINVAGIESPGLTSAPAIAKKIIDMMCETDILKDKKENFVKRKKPIIISDLNFEEKNKLIKNNPKYGKIVCRCENISEGEIIDAIRRNTARTVDGIKHRIRPGMGRCQGSFCVTKVMEILSKELKIPINKITKKGKNSRMVM